MADNAVPRDSIGFSAEIDEIDQLAWTKPTRLHIEWAPKAEDGGIRTRLCAWKYGQILRMA
jgi:hypothetical protein